MRIRGDILFYVYGRELDILLTSICHSFPMPQSVNFKDGGSYRTFWVIWIEWGQVQCSICEKALSLIGDLKGH